MSLPVPGVGDVPIVWIPSPDHWNGRFGYRPEAIVHHRAVANTLNSIDASALSDERTFAPHFGIGDYRAPDGTRSLQIHQYVNLADSAWHAGVRSDGADIAKWYAELGPKRLPNGYWDINARTIGIEHDDNGGSKDPAKKGIVTEAIIATSIELDRLMLSGDRAAMREAGIRIRDDGTAEALGKIPVDGRHLVDHRNITTGKPYCWRPWKADQVGFPRARYVSALQPVVAEPKTYSQAEVDALIAQAVEPFTDRIAELEAAIASDAQVAATVAALLRDAAEDLEGR